MDAVVKKRIFAGCVCEQYVYRCPPQVRHVREYEPKPRFKNDQERAAHREAKSRRHHAQLFNANFDPSALYSTLTFDNDHEVHTWPEADKILTNYIRRLKHAYPDAVIFAYKGRGKSTDRIHVHMVSKGIPEDVIRGKWGMGKNDRIEPLREHNYYDGEDYGQDYTGLANYLFDHWTEDQGGKRWKMTKNAVQPETEKPKAVRRHYTKDHPPIPPKGYKLVDVVDTHYGLIRYKYVKIPEPPKRTRKPKKPRNPYYTDW